MDEQVNDSEINKNYLEIRELALFVAKLQGLEKISTKISSRIINKMNVYTKNICDQTENYKEMVDEVDQLENQIKELKKKFDGDLHKMQEKLLSFTFNQPQSNTNFESEGKPTKKEKRDEELQYLDKKMNELQNQLANKSGNIS